MAGTKRASTGGESPAASTRSHKKAKVDSKESKNGAKEKVAKKPAISPSKFMDSALPLHFNITHTPPSIEEVPTFATDPKVIGHVSSLPTKFSTGSLGWKGSKRLTIEVGGEKLQVMLNINATVLGSKPSKDDTGDDGSKSDNEDDEEKEAMEDAAEEVLAEREDDK